MPKKIVSKDKTKVLILKKSLSLFNQKGVHAVSAHDISRELNISVGNLTYYFRKKNDIVDELSEQLKKEMVVALEFAKVIEGTAEEISTSIFHFTGLFWKYRFFFNNVLYIASKDIKQRAQYLTIKSLVISALTEAYVAFQDKGAAKPVKSPNSLDLVIENLWYSWLGYLRMYIVENPTSKISKGQYTRFAALHMYSFLEPYYTEDVSNGIFNKINKIDNV